MDFTKYVSMIKEGGLYFSRADLLGDPLEGSFPRSTILSRRELYAPMVAELNARGDPVTADEFLEEIANLFQQARRAIFVNCWHESEFESVAMWKLYSSSSESIAIKSSYGRLIEILDDSCFVGSIEYLDFQADTIDDWNAFSGIMHKRSAFQHEREVRALSWHQALSEAAARLGEDEQVDVDLDRLPKGIWKRLSLPDLIDGIYVSPASPVWFAELVESVSRRYELGIPVHRSVLEAEPTF